LGIVFFFPVATGFLVGFFLPTRILVVCAVPVAVIVVNVIYAMVMHSAFSMIGILIGIVIAYPTALSVNRFMHD
jgi:predicted membrane chloride channel (bestrophin family)